MDIGNKNTSIAVNKRHETVILKKVNFKNVLGIHVN